LVPFWAKDIKVGFSNINAKAEGIEHKPAFREAFRQRRWLVPVDSFYEWKKTPSGKQPYAIALAVSPRVGNVRNNDPGLIEPTAAAG
jgi:putative SOS response-associated peptidase YedK